MHFNYVLSFLQEKRAINKMEHGLSRCEYYATVRMEFSEVETKNATFRPEERKRK